MTNHTPQTQTPLDTELAELLAAWTAHQELHAVGAPLEELWHSRAVLDQRRLNVRLAA